MRTKKPLLKTLPEPLQDLFKSLQQASIPALIVGGLVRDFYLTGKWSSDIDLEVRCDDLRLQEFLREDSKVQEFEVLRFGVCRVRYDGLELEMAPARKETYHSSQVPTGHSDFEIHFLDAKASDKEAFLRRDFSINAMGLKLNDSDELVLVDPFNGLDHLEQGVLEVVHPEFHRDPLRLPRAVRFSLKYKLEYSSRLIESFTRMTLEKLSLKLLTREALKSSDLRFFSELFILIEDCGVGISKELRPLAFLREFQSSQTFEDVSELWIALCMSPSEEIQYQLDQAQESLMKAFELKQKEAAKTLRLMRFLRHEYEEAQEVVVQMESSQDCHHEIKSMISLMKWLDLNKHQLWIQKHAEHSLQVRVKEILTLSELYEETFQKTKSSAPLTPKLWEGHALKQALQFFHKTS